ncbi:MAG: AtpZ/AtpI family protein [Bacteroidota bacterium]
MVAPGQKSTPGDSERKWLAAFAPYLTIGMQLAIAVVGCFFLGRWLDEEFGTSPWLMITGLALGTAGGFISFFRSAMTMAKKEDELKHNKSKRVGREDR